MKIVGLAMCYNEEKFLPAWLANIQSFCDEVVVYDDGSTDNSVALLEAAGCYVIEGSRNEHYKESYHHATAYEVVRSLNPDWIFTNSLDERLPVDRDQVEILIQQARDVYAESITMYQAELWLSEHWMRTDNFWGYFPFVRFFRYIPSLKYEDSQLVENPHILSYPAGIQKLPHYKVASAQTRMLHYGYTELSRIKDRFYRMVDCYEKGKWGKVYQYLNWVRGVDGRGCNLVHLPEQFTGIHDCKCAKPEVPEWLLTPSEPGWEYIEKFGYPLERPQEEGLHYKVPPAWADPLRRKNEDT